MDDCPVNMATGLRILPEVNLTFFVNLDTVSKLSHRHMESL
jgi:hypothetical protein